MSRLLGAALTDPRVDPSRKAHDDGGKSQPEDRSKNFDGIVLKGAHSPQHIAWFRFRRQETQAN